MDNQNQKCDETFGRSLSSSSRRVMWKQSRSKRSTTENWVHIMKEMRRKKAAVGGVSRNSATSLQELPEATSKARIATYWHHLFGKISQKELNQAEAVEKEANLGLRYRPSHESLKLQRSKDHQAASRPVMTDLKLESCGLPPQQTCVVREVAPKFAHRMPTSVPNDTDSCCSGDLEGPKNSPVVKLSTASSTVSHSHPGHQQQQQHPQQQRFRTEVISVHVSTPSCSSAMATPCNKRTIQLGSKRRPYSKVTTIANASSTSSTPALAGNKELPVTGASINGNAAFPTFRQRQMELHRYRVQIEQRRLDLLELKIAREREDAVHQEILFHKDLQIRENQLKAYEDNDCSNA